MATTKEYIDFVCEQITGYENVRSKKMFGEYMVYLNEKPVLLVCDNTVFVKILPELSSLMASAERGFPYDGAKEHYVLDIENRELLRSVLSIVESVTPVPKKKKKKTEK